jgi:RNA polymerase sigma-70 factor (TIGR02957 family)
VTDITALHDELRPLMFSVAYGMLGSATEAEDVTQEALLRMYRESAPIRSPSAYAVTVTTRLAIDELRSARARREVYVGSWLPEPLVTTDAGDEPAAQAEAAERLSTALLVMLERLSPVERAVLLLRDIFDYDYDQIAEIVEKSAANCRQILTRAKAHLQESRHRFAVSFARRDTLARRFYDACQHGDLAALEELLAEDIRFTGDGGGKVEALPAPIGGRTRVARFLIGLFRKAQTDGIAVEVARVNGEPGLLARTADGTIVAVMSLVFGEAAIEAIYNLINPDKLRHLAG